MDKFRLTECQTLDIPVGNDVPLLVKLVKGFDGCDGEGAVPFPIDVCENVVVAMVSERGDVTVVDAQTGDGGELLLRLSGSAYKAGLVYGLDVRGTLNDVPWHAYAKSLVRITAATERGPKQVKVDADPYEVTLWAGYVGDVVPRHLRDLDGYTALTQLLDAMGETLGKKADTEDVTNALKNISDRFREYVPTSDKGKAGGVAALDSLGKILAAQLNMPWRGNFEGGFQDSNVAPGIWGIDGRRIGPNPLHGEDAHGVMLVFPDRYKTTVFIIAPPRDSQYGTAPEIYARRWMPAANSWTSWLTTADFLRRNEVDSYTLAKNGNYIQLRKNGELVNEVLDANTTYSAMSQAEAEAGTATTARTMSAKVLKAAIEKHTENKATIDFVNSSVQTATAEFRGTYQSVEELQEVEADRNDYAYVMDSDAGGNTIYKRYKYAEDTGWQWEYDLNCSGFTAAEWQTIKSGITPEDVEKLRELPEKDAVMPLTRITDRTKVEAVVDADGCTEPGIYENVQKPGIPNDFGLIITTQGEVCVLLVSEIYGENNHEVAVSIDSNGSQQVSEMFYKELVQFAVGKDFAAVRTCRKCLSPTDGRISIPTFTPWKQFAMKSDLRGNFKVEDIVIQYGGGPLPPPSKESLGKIFLMLDEKYDMYDTVGVPYYLRNMDYDDETGEIIYDWQPMVDLTNIPTRKQIEKDILPKNAPKLNRYKVGEEVLVGEWEEDGVTYDLYRKVVSFGNLPNAGQKTVAHGIADKVKFVGVSAMASNGFPIPFVTQDASKAIYLALGNNQITINTHATDRSALTADVTILFTRNKPV